jgi:hypothetical protein
VASLGNLAEAFGLGSKGLVIGYTAVALAVLAVAGAWRGASLRLQYRVLFHSSLIFLWLSEENSDTRLSILKRFAGVRPAGRKGP